MNNIFDKKTYQFNTFDVTSDLLIRKIAKQLLLSCGAIALKICHVTEHQKVDEQHI